MCFFNDTMIRVNQLCRARYVKLANFTVVLFTHVCAQRILLYEVFGLVTENEDGYESETCVSFTCTRDTG